VTLTRRATAAIVADEIPEAERLSADDQAALVAEQIAADALATHRARQARIVASVPGVCSNCEERCLPTAVYCDAECRDDHEKRLAADGRAGAGGWGLGGAQR
jgi:hypothetical protein